MFNKNSKPTSKSSIESSQKSSNRAFMQSKFNTNQSKQTPNNLETINEKESSSYIKHKFKSLNEIAASSKSHKNSQELT